jgi:crotonobetainyl-CoA:carnitine CoA-transferase CaiB-like acyl-CoA transferase
MSAPLEGIQVIEIASYVAAPAAGALLADFGADVVKVEVPEGEVIRHTRPRINGFKSRFEGSPQFEMDNRGKRSLTLDLRDEASREALRRVVDGTDVVLTNMLPGRRKKYGIDSDTLMRRNPRLIFAALSGYGGKGDEADVPAFDYAAAWARTGMMDITRDPSAPPAFQRPGVADHSAALSLVCGILAALRTRDQSGEGQEIDVSLLQTGLYLLGNDLSQVLATREAAPIHDRTAPRNPLWNHYRTRDDRWLMLVMIESHRYWEPFLAAIDQRPLAEDPRFTGPVERYRNARELVSLLDPIFREHDLERWAEILCEHDLIWAPVRTTIETLEDPQIRAMGYFRELPHPEFGTIETVGPPLLLSGHEMPANRPAPSLGADSIDVLRAAGLSEDEVAAVLGPETSTPPTGALP